MTSEIAEQLLLGVKPSSAVVTRAGVSEQLAVLLGNLTQVEQMLQSPLKPFALHGTSPAQLRVARDAQ
jgi:hypothetical protein